MTSNIKYLIHFKLLFNSFNKIEPITIFSQFTQISKHSLLIIFIVTNTNDFDAKVWAANLQTKLN